MRHTCHEGSVLPPAHTNAFLDVNGIPYLLAEYLDRRNFMQIDRSMIRSGIQVSTNEAMRAIVDISVDQIGKRTDGLPETTGNNTKLRQLLQMIHDNNPRLDHQFDVIRPGLVIRVNYQLENQRTGNVIRTMAEDLRIRDRTFFLDVNPRNINDNAIVVNFNDTLVSTINEFTHGTDPMLFRITTVQLYYEAVRRHPMMPTAVSGNTWGSDPLPRRHGSENEMYWYHRHQQEHLDPWGNSHQHDVIPPEWTSFNRYYHFDNDGHDMILHMDEIMDSRTSSVMLACGMVHVNRAFLINPGHRIVFRFSIWKNDLAVANDCLPIAQAIKAPIYDPYYYCGDLGERPQREPCCGFDPRQDCRHPPDRIPAPEGMWIGDRCHNHKHPHISAGSYPDMEQIIDLYNQSKSMDYQQNDAINRINDLLAQILAKLEITQEEGLPTLPGTPAASKPLPKPPKPVNMAQQIMQMLHGLQEQINDLKTGDGCGCPTVKPIPDKDITDAVDEAKGEVGNKPANPDPGEENDPVDPVGGTTDPDEGITEPGENEPDPGDPIEGGDVVNPGDSGTETGETTGDGETPEETGEEDITSDIYSLNI